MKTTHVVVTNRGAVLTRGNKEDCDKAAEEFREMFQEDEEFCCWTEKYALTEDIDLPGHGRAYGF